MPNTRRSYCGEDGIALVLAMFMVLVVSLLGASLASVGRTETLSSLNYKTMSQARYAAESGLHSAANHLIHTYEPPGVDAGDVMANYDVTVSPVEYNGEPVVLTTVEDAESNYPVDDKVTAFEDDSHGELVMATTKANYTATATLLSMRQFPDAYSGGNITIQKWLITGMGSIDGAGAADVQVSAVIETQAVPAYRYAAFATDDGCDALYFGGGGETFSYNSQSLKAGKAVASKSDGDVGTNGSLTVSGAKTVINGKLSTPNTGVGNCEDGAIVALDGEFGDGVPKPDVQGMVKLPQPVVWKTPAAISPAPPTTPIDFKKTGGCPAGAPAECTQAGDVITITPVGSTPVQMGNVSMSALAEVHLKAGTYEVNSLSINGNAKVYIDSGPVVFKVNGKNVDGSEIATPIDVNGGGVLNSGLNPKDFQFVYGGSAEVKLNGGSSAAFLTYAPNATVTLNGNADIYGAVVGRTVKDNGGAKLYYDVNLKGWAYTEGNPTMTSFTWSSSD
jgi:Tfp pilus assembly protein PilX